LPNAHSHRSSGQTGGGTGTGAAGSAGPVMPDKKTLRTIEELRRVVRALGFEFDADTVFVVGSQAILASMPDAPEVVRQSLEFDAFPGNARMWEIAQKELAPGVRPIASEHIHG